MPSYLDKTHQTPKTREEKEASFIELDYWGQIFLYPGSQRRSLKLYEANPAVWNGPAEAKGNVTDHYS